MLHLTGNSMDDAGGAALTDALKSNEVRQGGGGSLVVQVTLRGQERGCRACMGTLWVTM